MAGRCQICFGHGLDKNRSLEYRPRRADMMFSQIPSQMRQKPRICAEAGLALALALIISACTTENQQAAQAAPGGKTVSRPGVTAPPSSPPESTEKIAEKSARANAQTELDSLITLYNNGDYHGAIKRLSTIEDTLKPYKEMELQALKLTAFSYCLTGRQPQCKQEFERALKLDPSFDLEKGEKGHPLWQHTFDRAKKDATK